MPGNKKGDRRERELVNELDARGFAVMRAPASGSSTDRELPDVLAGDSTVFYAIEGKASSGGDIYLSAEEIEALVYFSQNFGAKARVGVRFDVSRGDPPWGVDDDPGWRFFHPDELYQTDSGKNYRVKKKTAYADGADLASLVARNTTASTEP